MSRTRRGPAAISEPSEHGLLELVPDADRPGGWTLRVDGTPQSHVDLDDPTTIHFEYMRRLASVADATAPAGTPLRVLHLGGGALTLPRYVAVTRRGSAQQVVELDPAVVALVRRVLPTPRGADIRVRVGDGRAAVESSGPARYDLVVTDVYGGSRVPAPFTSVEFAGEVARVLRPDGRYVANLADGAPLNFARGQVATLRAVFADVCLLAEPGVLRGRRFGNVVLVASSAPLPVAALATAAARDAFPARLLHGEELDRFTGGARPVADAAAVASPPPPAGMFPG
ncbi:fused MFS/spermidine synthase [Longispora sp. K20-0274]|uniref:spermidine synthase n=1 Tax=Longispora sp. K20-0274 TaxID=3088255 RepID=UPI00399A8BA9